MSKPADLQEDESVSLLSWGSLLLRRRKFLVSVALVGALVGLLSGLLSPRLYKTTVIFLPQGSAENISGIQLAASQFGLDVPSGSGEWWPAIYVELLQSRALLEPIASDTLMIPEKDSARVAVMDLLRVRGVPPDVRLARAVTKLRTVVHAGEDAKLHAVKVDVLTRWPSVSLTVAEKLLSSVNRFNIETRKSQAEAERRFVSEQVADAERNLRTAENQMEAFLQRNRVAGSPQLTFQKDRLEREVSLKQEIFTTLSHELEEARIREVRNTPVITILEDPRLAVIGESRGAVLRLILGGILGMVLGVSIVFGARNAARARQDRSEQAREFFALVKEATPSFLRKWLPQ